MASLNNTTQRECGNIHAEADMIDTYIQCWPFDAALCSFCGDVVVNWGPAKAFAFDMLIGWWWTGAVLAKKR